MALEVLSSEARRYFVERLAKGDLFDDVRDEAETFLDIDPTFADSMESILQAEGDALRQETGMGVEAELAYWRAFATPTITSITPAVGDTAGGERAVIIGTGFAPGATVKIGGHLQTVVSVRPTEIVIRTVAHATAAAADLIVTNPSTKTVTAAAAFEFAATTPVFTSITPATGKAAGGSIHHIIGTAFTPGMTVKIGGHLCKVLSRGGSTHVAIKLPAHAAGALDVVLTAVNTATDTDVGGFTYV